MKKRISSINIATLKVGEIYGELKNFGGGYE